MARRFDYVRDPGEIYRRSFAVIRREADLEKFPGAMQAVAERLVHACGMPGILAGLAFSEGAADAGRRALQAGAAVLVDTEMVAHGIIRSRLPANNPILCTLNDPRVADMAKQKATTRSAAAVDLWGGRLEGAVVAIGNAPTALFRLLELLGGGAPRPAFIAGFPVGFIGAAESKQALVEYTGGVPFIALKGRQGGSALAAACVNGLGAGEAAGEN